MDDLRLQDLEIRVQRDGDRVTVSWHGISDGPNPGAELSPYLEGLVHASAGAHVEIDFTGMDYMNSATIAPIIRFIRALNDVCSKVSVFYDETRNFQRTTFSAIKAMGIVLDKLEVLAR